MAEQDDLEFAEWYREEAARQDVIGALADQQGKTAKVGAGLPTLAEDGSLAHGEFDEEAVEGDDEGEPAANVFCPTGEGGGVDPHCKPGGQKTAPAREPFGVAPTDKQPGPETAARQMFAELNKQAGLHLEEKAAGEIKLAPPSDESAKSLRSTPISSSKPLNSGANKTSVLTLSDGSKAVWKPADGEADLRETVPKGGYYKREAAAYAVATQIGMHDLVPPTVTREIDGKVGSVQKWVHGAEVAVKTDYARRPDGDKDLARAAAFDILIGQTDRHPGNWMVGEKGSDRDSKLTLIDNGTSFPTGRGEFMSSFLGYAFERRLKIPDEVKSWDEKKIEGVLRAHELEESAVQSALYRLRKLKKDVGKGFNFDW